MIRFSADANNGEEYGEEYGEKYGEKYGVKFREKFLNGNTKAAIIELMRNKPTINERNISTQRD